MFRRKIINSFLLKKLIFIYLTRFLQKKRKPFISNRKSKKKIKADQIQVMFFVKKTMSDFVGNDV